MSRHINIIPVFNQSSLFWATFADVQSRAILGAYCYYTSQEEMAFEIAKLSSAWHRFKSHYAFGAYDGDKMVGCINGLITRGGANVSGLYVLPDYQKMGIGARMLAAAERSASVHVTQMELFALDGATTFYESHKYNLAPKTGQHIKSIFNAARDTVVPIFWCRPEMTAAYQRIAELYDLRFDAEDVNTRHMPMFAYIDKFGRPVGYIRGIIRNHTVHVTHMCINDGASMYVSGALIRAMAQMNVR